MHLQPKGSTDLHDRFHVPAGIGKALLLTGVVEEVPLVRPGIVFDPNLAVKWTVLANGVYPPVLRAVCPQCKSETMADPQSGNAHKFLALRHVCGYAGDQIPPEVVVQYVALHKQWKERTRSRTKNEPQPAQPKRVFFTEVGR
jgi:hypothetical protein